MTYWHIIILIAVLQVVDIATTVYILRTGIGYEANPIMRKLFEEISMVPALLVIKGATAAAAWHWRDAMGMVGLGLLCAGYIAVAVNNVLVIRRQSRGR